MTKYTWGTWFDSWPRGRFVCTFHAAKPDCDWIEATGLYRAKDGDTLRDLDTVEADIAQRIQIAGEGGLIRVRATLVSAMGRVPKIPAETMRRSHVGPAACATR